MTKTTLNLIVKGLTIAITPWDFGIEGKEKTK